MFLAYFILGLIVYPLLPIASLPESRLSHNKLATFFIPAGAKPEVMKCILVTATLGKKTMDKVRALNQMTSTSSMVHL